MVAFAKAPSRCNASRTTCPSPPSVRGCSSKALTLFGRTDCEARGTGKKPCHQTKGSQTQTSVWIRCHRLPEVVGFGGWGALMAAEALLKLFQTSPLRCILHTWPPLRKFRRGATYQERRARARLRSEAAAAKLWHFSAEPIARLAAPGQISSSTPASLEMTRGGGGNAAKTAGAVARHSRPVLSKLPRTLRPRPMPAARRIHDAACMCASM